MKSAHVRLARAEDAEALLDIYAPYVRDTAISFEYEVPSTDEFRRRIAEFSAVYPYLVCEDGGEVLGYAYAHRFHERRAYQWTAEISVYLSDAARGQGLGSRLTKTLLELLRLQNICCVYSLINRDNAASLQMSERLGFRTIGEYSACGYKFGRWHDILTLELRLASPVDPAPLRTIHQVSPRAVQCVLEQF